MPMDRDGGLQSSPCSATLINLLSAIERQIASGARLQRSCQREQEGRRSERTEVRQARLSDRRRVYGEESVAFSESINVELHSEGSIMSTCTDVHSSTHQ